ncbi:IclR family transcriptional regulator [Agrilactobacillus fermenti]|uniref:IclR family transcriptional regulator n=1 Tax=Agrilactobacillus fermenti TaxID=2586909 RepID=UPI003A5C598C
MSETTEQPLYGTVLLKAKQLIDVIAKSSEPLTLKQISDQVPISKPTVLKILRTLIYCGFIRENAARKTYDLGTIFLEYGQRVAASFDIKASTRPFLEQLRDETNETVNLGIVEDHRIVLLDKLESPRSVKLVSRIGGTMNMYSSAMGKAILASYEPQDLQTYLAHTSLKALTPNTITDPEQLQLNLKTIQKKGYAIDNIENQPDIFCVGFDLIKHHHVYGAFSISAPEYRVNEQVFKGFIKYGLQTRQAILASLS